jgi:5-methylcytosine-specific restriction protein A
MARALKVCAKSGCPELVPTGRCDEHERQDDRRRGTASQRGYTSAGHKRFRTAVLSRDPLCVCTDIEHGHGEPCLVASTVADHHPSSRKDLLGQGLNPNDPIRGRGVCKSCHDRSTAVHQPGGWNA